MDGVFRRDDFLILISASKERDEDGQEDEIESKNEIFSEAGPLLRALNEFDLDLGVCIILIDVHHQACHICEIGFAIFRREAGTLDYTGEEPVSKRIRFLVMFTATPKGHLISKVESLLIITVSGICRMVRVPAEHPPYGEASE